jgi:predicted GNAT family acetyltransferase
VLGSRERPDPSGTAQSSGLRPGGGIRVLGEPDRSALDDLLRRDPFANAVVAARVEAVGSLDPMRLGGELLGQLAGLDSACFWGGALLPIGGHADSWLAFARHLAQRPRLCASVIGRSETLEVMWPVLTRAWGAARIVRAAQPLLVSDAPAAVEPDPLVRPARLDEVDAYLPAAAAMFAEELETSAFRNGGRAAYRARLETLIANRRAFVRFDADGQVVFKAEFAAVSSQTCQVQGVWVRPQLRGRGIGLAAMAAVIRFGLAQAPTVSLYVNDFNERARRLYARLGMRQDCVLSSILF